MHRQLMEATTPDRRIQHEMVGNRMPNLILQEHYPLLDGTTCFWYGTDKTLVRHRYTVAAFRIKYKNLN
jgi:hypothetical protein